MATSVDMLCKSCNPALTPVFLSTQIYTEVPLMCQLVTFITATDKTAASVHPCFVIMARQPTYALPPFTRDSRSSESTISKKYCGFSLMLVMFNPLLFRPRNF